MKNTPPGWPRISSSLTYDNASEAIDWLCRAFGFRVRLKVEGEGGRIEHSELTFGDGVIMVGDVSGKPGVAHMRSPKQAGGTNTQALFVYVDDIEAHCRRAGEAGAEITSPLKTSDYGSDYWVDRSYGCVDPGGHHWWFAERVSTSSTYTP